MSNGIDFDFWKKIGECATAFAAVVAIPLRIFPTKWALKKVDDDLQTHKADDKEKHLEHMQYLRDMEERIIVAVHGNSARDEGRINRIESSIDSRFATFEKGITTLITEILKVKK